MQYAITDATTLGLSARKGYNAAGGALNFTEQEYYYYDEEEVYTYELSSRTLLNNNTYISANLFYNDYSGFQALSSTRFIVNMPDVKTYGLEAELNTNLTEDLQVNVGLGLLHTEITDAGEQYPDVDGNKLNSAPDFNASIGLKYWVTDAINVGGSVRYVGEYFGDFSNTEARIGGDYTLTRLTANYENENWTVTAFVDNLFDETAIITQEPVSGRYPAGYAAIADPRNVGVSVIYKF